MIESEVDVTLDRFVRVADGIKDDDARAVLLSIARQLRDGL